MLMNAPTGLSWNLIPKPKADSQEQLAEVTNICWRATSIVDTYCNQVLRATVDTEQLQGPGNVRVGVQRDTGNGILIMRRWPVTNVLAIQTAAATGFPRVWSAVPAGKYAVAHPLINMATDTASATSPDGAMSVLVAPGYITWDQGRNGLLALVSYTNGWPHTSLTQPAAVGATVLNVDDVTGFAGATGFAYDGADTEAISVTSVTAATPLPLPNGAGTAQSGPGTITLASPLTYAHDTGVVVSSLPANVLWAAVLAAATQVLESGNTAITVQNLPGSLSTGGTGIADLEATYKKLLDPFRRII
jgi:hypothetical protein